MAHIGQKLGLGRCSGLRDIFGCAKLLLCLLSLCDIVEDSGESILAPGRYRDLEVPVQW